MPIITLLTDFGTRDAYVAAMKGVLLGIAPEAVLVDVTHEIAPQDVGEGAFALGACWRCFPAGTVHLAVVDPGVGSARRAIAVEAAGHRFVAPDNGLLGMALSGIADRRIVSLENPAYFRPEISPVFHGRDLFAPVAAHLSRGIALSALGPMVPDMVVLPQAQPRVLGDDAWGAAVIAADRFGNLITNVPGALVRGKKVRVSLCGVVVEGLREHYAQAAPGDLLLLIGSAGYLEVACNLGSAAERLGARRGSPLTLTLRIP